MAWLLRRIRQSVTRAHPAFLDWSDFRAEYRGLFLWEAFVSATSKRDSHVADATAAAEAFVDALPDPQTCVQCPGATYSLIGAALLRTNWTADINVLSSPSLVIRAVPRLS